MVLTVLWDGVEENMVFATFLFKLCYVCSFTKLNFFILFGSPYTMPKYMQGLNCNEECIEK